MSKREAAMMEALRQEALAEERVDAAKRHLQREESQLTAARNAVSWAKHWFKQETIGKQTEES